MTEPEITSRTMRVKLLVACILPSGIVARPGEIHSLPIGVASYLVEWQSAQFLKGESLAENDVEP